MIVEISLAPPASLPVTAVIVHTALIGVPELVMNAFEPLMTHSPPSRTAVVLGGPGVGAAVGLGEAERRRGSLPRHIGDSQRSFWACVPKR